MKKVGFFTLGCKVNQYETQAMMERFKSAGYEIVDFEQTADAYVINTCTVTSLGDKKSRKIIRRAQKNNPQAVIAVVGCYSQISPEEVEKIKGIDVIAGTGEKSNIVQLVEAAFEGTKTKLVADIMKQREFEETGFITCNENKRAFLKIQEGCDRFCSYCIIPYARGPIRSRSKESILNEVKALKDNGFKEVVLTGIHLSSYGKDLENISLINIIEEISQIDGLRRIRLGSIEPGLITPEFISRIKDNKKLCPHYHVSLQSGSDSVLKRMNRRYTSADYEARIQLLRNNIPDVSVATDIMVGFPGETAEEFKETYEFLNRISLNKMHVFKYSQRRGTPAAKYPNQVDPAIKEERSNLLIQMSDIKEEEFQERFLGRTMEVLLEQEADFDKEFLTGHTGNFLQVAVKAEKVLIEEIKKVELIKIENKVIIGSMI
jgi:threonylcarbamoyladenosine tRNA methylthiotransferase MtaB